MTARNRLAFFLFGVKMASFTSLQTTEQNEHHRNIFSLLAKHENEATVNDGHEEIILDSGELAQIKGELSAIVQDSRASTGAIQTASEMKEKLLTDFPKKMQQLVQDRYANAQGFGTPIDPGMNVESFVPVSILPDEATAYYAGGGIPARIINKKAGCLTLDGIKFDCSEMEPDDLQKLEDYAKECGFEQAYTDSITQSLIFGGAICYPVLKNDNPLTFQKSLKELCAGLKQKEKFINYWVTADRWNCVFVPEYNITAQDYLFARTLFIPLGGVRVNTDRMAMVRPSKLPFWGAIQQLGWSTSDFEGWIKDFESYQIMKMSLPIMAQQSSLMYHAIPADGLIIENGPEYAKQFFKENEKQMREWSMLNPRTINSVGEIKILDRTYSGYHDLLTEARLGLCASSGLAESILFEQKSTGLASDNREDVTLKQSEMIRLLFNNVAPSFKNCIELLVYSCFGVDSEQAKLAKTVKIKADSGYVLSDMDKSTLGNNFSQILEKLCACGIPLDKALSMSKDFIPSAKIDSELIESITAGESEGISADLWEQLTAGRAL